MRSRTRSSSCGVRLPVTSPGRTCESMAALYQLCREALDRCIRKGSRGSQSRRLLASDGTAERGFMSKVWLITGASRGLGRAFTQAVLDAGDRVIATARKPEQLVGLMAR